MENKLSFTGIIGAVIGALVGSIPWIIVNVYLGITFSYGGFIIAVAAHKGYQLLGGKPNKALPWLIGIIAVATAVFNGMFSIPMLQLFKADVPMTIDNLIYNFYDNSSNLTSIIIDTVVAVVFVLLGSIGMLASLKAQVNPKKTAQSAEHLMNEEEMLAQKAPVDDNVLGLNNNNYYVFDGVKENDDRSFASTNETETELSVEQRLRKHFMEANALSPETAVDFSFNDGFEVDDMLSLMNKGALKKTEDGRYYLDPQAQPEPEKKKNKHKNHSKGRKIILISLAITAVVLATIFLVHALKDNSGNKTKAVKNEYVRFSVPQEYEVEEYGENDGDIGWTIYSPEEDDGSYCIIFVTLYDASDIAIEDLRNEYEIDDFAGAKIKQYKTKRGYDALNVVTVYEEYDLYIDDVICDNIDVEIFCYYFGNGRDYIEATDLIADTVIRK